MCETILIVVDTMKHLLRLFVLVPAPHSTCSYGSRGRLADTDDLAHRAGPDKGCFKHSNGILESLILRI